MFDRAYNDYDFWGKIMKANSDFVTRLKDCPRNWMLQMKVLVKVGSENGVLYDGPYRPPQFYFNFYCSSKKSQTNSRGRFGIC